MIAIHVEELVKTYQVSKKKKTGVLASLGSLFKRETTEIHAVDRVSFQIDVGEMVAFLGPNGAGKTTTLKMLSGLIFPNSGTATVLGFTPWERLFDYRRSFSLIMGQKNQLWWDLPAIESFHLHKEIYRIEPTQFESTLNNLVELLSLENRINHPVRELSLGERMKMELVAALLHQPRILFLDEPTIGLDVVAQNQLREFLREYNQKYEVTTILTSHYMKDVEHLCNRAIIINQGKIVVDDSLREIVDRFSSHKILRVQLSESEFGSATDQPDFFKSNDLECETVEWNAPIAKLKIPKAAVAKSLSLILNRYEVQDVTVEDPPLENVIAQYFHTEDDELVEINN